MRFLSISLGLLVVLVFSVPPSAAACTPQEIDYVVLDEFDFTCHSGTLHSVRAVDISGKPAAVEVCYAGNPCISSCEPILFQGNGQGTIHVRVLNALNDQFALVCASTAGTLYING